ncbi:MAG: thiamine pyrophosphate-binding protein [Moorea sp. SIO1F2]|uniref:thiamine pyrophosphate-dependent enzyme n=1 Tax=Moorena sp. SIO1F2 TaxID=2607819 RepID=UPI0013BB5034|nr:thiamine pyrophosphate-dependent enzyme [Moorena sp. SIO1F2]NET85780.1 thiamine pyrophosphate-binding protein [Moorena sp. SIO1F2]
MKKNIPSSSYLVAQAVVKMLEDLGVRYAFGIAGGAIGAFWAALQYSSIKLLNFRHESGAVFAAIEFYLASNNPVVVFTTTGPGITNALTGIMAAKWEGAKVILVSPSTSSSQRGRWAFQETSAYTFPQSDIFTSGKFFDFGATLETPSELLEISRRLALGLTHQGGFVAHISIPTAIQTTSIEIPNFVSFKNLSYPPVTVSSETINKCAQLLLEGPFAIWIGYGSRHAAETIRILAERTGAAVMSSPRGKGIFPENHPQFVGVTGFAGHDSVFDYLKKQCPLRTLVLGTRLGEFTSFWNPILVPSKGFIHVDINPDVPGTAYPDVEILPIQSDIRTFVKTLLEYIPQHSNKEKKITLPNPKQNILEANVNRPVRPEVLMEIIQQVIVEGSQAIVMTEAGNSFAWGTHMLRFSKPGRYRVSTGFGSMGHGTTGVLGAALALQNTSVAIIGDGAMLMNNEVSTAVRYHIPAVWIVLNDGRYNMVDQGAQFLGIMDMDVEIPPTDFALMARSMGADGIRVEQEANIKGALEKAMSSSLPFVVDVIIDPTRLAPSGSRNQSLNSQGVQGFKF